MEIYQDRICFLAGEENGLGRFLKEHGKSDKTRAGKMMVAAGKTMSYTGQQRLAIRCVSKFSSKMLIYNCPQGSTRETLPRGGHIQAQGH